ncbi:MAG: ABC transporter ATP-binding protein [archaeon]|jgi:putative ABC transport system ATP-binding protein|nr:ABC transporter ATP-binding protein [archaeon]
MTKTTVLEAKDVFKIYDMGKIQVHALSGVSLTVNKGDYISIMGPSGSGKTTLLDVLSALLRPTKGEILIREKPISKMDDNELARVRGKTIGFVFQTFNLIQRMSALENVMLPLWFQGVNIKEREVTARKILDRVGLGDRVSHRPTELSGGERQRVAIARALAVDPDVIVADEPTGNLDSKSGEQILKLIDDLNKKEGKTVLMVTHERSVGTRAHKIIHLKDGKIIKNETTRRN